MSYIVVMEMLWPLIVLFAASTAHSHKESQTRGLACVNDFVRNVSCTWSSSPVAPGVDCWIHGTKTIWIFENQTRYSRLIIQSCKLKPHETSPPGCTFAFENHVFNRYEFNNISMECDGKLLENLPMFEPYKHIQMNPPGVPAVSSTANETLISWSPGSPLSSFLITLNFQVQIKLKQQMWKEDSTLSTQEPQLKIHARQPKGHYQVRVRVSPGGTHSGHWSNWSPTTSWTASHGQDRLLPPTLLIMWAVMLPVGFLVVVLVFYLCCVHKGCCRRLKVKPVPNPSYYFHTIHSVQGGNLKKWLNPLSAPESYFMAQPGDHISPVEVCEGWDTVPPASPSSISTIALLHIGGFPSAGSDTSKVVDDSSSSSSSCFSNMGYFMSSTSSSVARTDPNPVYFTYQDDFHNLHNEGRLHLALCPSLTSSSAYERLKREPQSPDSGFGIGQEDEEDKSDKTSMAAEGDEVSDDPLSSPPLILPLHPPSWVCFPSSVLSPLHLPGLNQIYSDSQEEEEEEEEEDVAAADSNYAAWPVAGPMCRSSSMSAEPCKRGYLTIKELQTTFSNKSI
ncbi:interleukin-2 receptor subunit beta isoform X1 [Hippoglossus stenolepis]|uniref:interleukin-2 receptor subunit beta isoform X1 n=1 Tax=Hippoglossus stenolepis TaxID=195615 RepID=UPI00159C295C|nr:interleukin-2 receptor subunit beta isoform X1 [Hippoglossus stenolepis]